MDSIPLEFHTPTLSEVLDFGRIFQQWPSSVLKPNTSEEISLLLKYVSSSPSYNNLTVAPRGAGHSTHGQAQALDGIVIDMTSLPTYIKINKTHSTNGQIDRFYVDVGGGVLWADLLEETLKHGLTPKSWTDYLFLSVGGTLSVGGISGQTFKYGPQICNVLEMDVITGRGDFVTCSKEKSSELFYGVLGGLGQFGIIVRARIILEIAPKMVKCTTVSYNDFSRFTRDQELLISMKEVDYLEGFIKRSDSETLDRSKFSHLNLDMVVGLGIMAIYYTIEMAIYCNGEEDVQQTMDQILSRLSFSSVVHSFDVSYFDFLNRVRQEEQKLRSNGKWEVPHPWLTIFVPRFQINKFKDLVHETISSIHTKGPIIIYPILRHKWNPRMSVVLPRNEVGDEDILYVIGLLHSAVPSSCLQMLLDQNQRIIDDSTASTNGGVRSDETDNTKEDMDLSKGGGCIGAKQYMPYCRDESEWKVHFGEEWERFQALKSKFDPLNILGPGQRIFKRIST